MPKEDPVHFLRLSKKDLSESLDELRAELKDRSPADIAGKTGAELKKEDDGEESFNLSCFFQDYTVSLPDFTVRDSRGQEGDLLITGFIIYYLYTADGTQEVNQWVSLREIPGGTFYADAFKGYTGDVLADSFRGDVEGLEKACRGMGGVEMDLGDLGFTFQLLPRVKLCLVYWQEDEEFPASARILFEASAANYLPCDVLAVLGAQLVRRICNYN